MPKKRCFFFVEKS